MLPALGNGTRQPGDGVAIGHVERGYSGVATSVMDAVLDRLKRCRVARDQHDMRACGGQRLRCCRADTLARAGNQRNLAVQIHVR